MPDGGGWHLYEGQYCPKCHSRRIHKEYSWKETILLNGKSIPGPRDGKVLSREEGRRRLHEIQQEYREKDTVLPGSSYPQDLDDDPDLKKTWRCRACGETFEKPLVVPFYADERYVERSHFGCPSYRWLMKRKTRER